LAPPLPCLHQQDGPERERQRKGDNEWPILMSPARPGAFAPVRREGRFDLMRRVNGVPGDICDR
jgi:hypothetical protein